MSLYPQYIFRHPPFDMKRTDSIYIQYLEPCTWVPRPKYGSGLCINPSYSVKLKVALYIYVLRPKTYYVSGNTMMQIHFVPLMEYKVLV